MSSTITTPFDATGQAVAHLKRDFGRSQSSVISRSCDLAVVTLNGQMVNPYHREGIADARPKNKNVKFAH